MLDRTLGLGTHCFDAIKLPGQRAAPQVGTQLLGCGHDQTLQLVDGLRAADQDRLPSGDDHPQRLSQTVSTHLGLVLTRESLPGGAGSVDLVVLGAALSLDPADLDDLFAGLGKEHRQPGGEAPGALQRPHPSTRGVAVGPGEHPCIAGAVGTIGQLCTQRPGRRIDNGQVDGVTVRVAADDELVLLCEHGHERLSSH